jgi:CRISPR-associated protein Csm5
MPDYAVYTVKATTLTPLHIGSGRELLHQYDYAIEGGHTWRINEAAVLEAQIGAAETLSPALADKLARTPPAQLLKRPADFKPDSGLFRYVLKGTPRATGEGAQLREQLKDPFDRAYLPGSSLKGALRTALAWQLWADRRLQPDVRRLGRRREWAAQEYERDLLGPDPNHDLLRALQVADSAPLGADRLMIVNARVVGRGGKLGSPIELEAVRPDTAFELTFKLDLALFSDWATRAGLHLPGGDRLSRLAETARTYTAARLPREKVWFDQIPGAARVAAFYGQMVRARPSQPMFLLQVGWGAGWHSKTFGTHLADDPAFMERVIEDYRLARGARKQGDPFPKSRRVAVAFSRDASGQFQETPASPFGWLLVEMRERT